MMIYYSTLKQWFMIAFALDLFYESQTLIQTTAKLEWDEVLIIQGFKVRVILLKICDSLITSSTSSEVIRSLVFSK